MLDRPFVKENSRSKNSNKINGDNENWIIIEPIKFISSLDLGVIWSYRELLYFLALRDIKIRYKQTLLGISWVVLQPTITTIIFTTVFSRFEANQNLEVPYSLFTFSGFVLWAFISSSILNCGNSLINHSNLITKVYFPRLIIPISAVVATLVDLLFGVLSLFVAMFFYKVIPSWQSILIIFLIIPAFLLSLGAGIIFASLNVKYRDIKYILPFIIQILFFISPIFYSLSILPKDKLWLWKLNPITGFLENFRALLFGLSFDWYSLGIATVFLFYYLL